MIEHHLVYRPKYLDEALRFRDPDLTPAAAFELDQAQRDAALEMRVPMKYRRPQRA